jgi:HSP20 family protein
MKRHGELRTVSAESPASGEKAVTRARESFPTLASEFGSIMAALGSMERLIENAFRRTSFGWLPSREIAREFGSLGEVSYYPTVDIYEHENDFVVKAELPGMKRDDISVKFTGDNTLVITGERKSEEKVERSDYWRHESSYGTFTRSFGLPESCDCDKAKASYKDGVLEIRIPKSEEAAKARSIPVE